MHGFAFAGSIAGIIFSSALVYSQLRLTRKRTYISLIFTRKLFDYWPFVMIACFICSRALVEHSPYTLDAIELAKIFSGYQTYSKEKKIFEQGNINWRNNKNHFN